MKGVHDPRKRNIRQTRRDVCRVVKTEEEEEEYRICIVLVFVFVRYVSRIFYSLGSIAPFSFTFLIVAATLARQGARSSASQIIRPRTAVTLASLPASVFRFYSVLIWCRKASEPTSFGNAGV
jgi:hypothetical protein